MKGRAIPYSAEELAFLEERRTMPRRELHAAFVIEFGRDDVSIENLKRLCFRKGWPTGRSGRFDKGLVPANKGMRCPPGKGGRHPNAQKTQFRKGNRPHTFRGAGHERIDSKNGYVVLIVAETNPWTGAATRPVFKHRWLWEQKHGPVPEGHVLKCRDGDKTNCDPSNWDLVPRALLPRLNGRFGRGYDEAPAELKPTIMAVAKLEHGARERQRGAR